MSNPNPKPELNPNPNPNPNPNSNPKPIPIGNPIRDNKTVKDLVVIIGGAFHSTSLYV